MGPAGAVALPGGNTHASQRSHRQDTLLTAAAQSPAKDRQGAERSVVGGGVGGVGVAPIIHGQSRLLQGFAPDMGQKRLHQISTAVVQTLGIDPVVQYIGEENLPGDGGAIFQLRSGFQSGFHIPGNSRDGLGQHILGCYVTVKIPQAEGKVL